jgi:histone deacetylase 1/2
VEFDNVGFSIKDRHTSQVLLRCDSSGDLYPVTMPSAATSLHATTDADLWHQRLGHPGRDNLSRTLKTFADTHVVSSSTCNACQLGKNVRFPFSNSSTISFHPFQLVHCDLWTSPVPSVSGFKYYLVLLDDFSHFAWTFPLRRKSETFDTIRRFHAFVSTQFRLPLVALQTDNGREFDNLNARQFFDDHGIALRLSCPYTSPQNGRAERILRTLNETTRTLLFHAHMPAAFWVEALATSTFLVNRRPCRPRKLITPFELLYGAPPDYSGLRVFGCL